jgi:hypothetical protein
MNKRIISFFVVILCCISYKLKASEKPRTPAPKIPILHSLPVSPEKLSPDKENFDVDEPELVKLWKQSQKRRRETSTVISRKPFFDTSHSPRTRLFKKHAHEMYNLLHSPSPAKDDTTFNIGKSGALTPPPKEESKSK